MRIPPVIKNPFYSAITFFGTILILSVGYGALVWGLSTADKVGTGSGLTSASWNRIVDGVLDLNTRLSNLSFSGGNVGIGTPTPWDTLTINGGVTATRFTASTAWTAVPGNATWTSGLTCRRVGSMLQFNGAISLASGGTTAPWWGIILTLPLNCRPSIGIAYISAVCWTNGGTASAGLVSISTNGDMMVYNNTNPFTYFSFPGTYPAD